MPAVTEGEPVVLQEFLIQELAAEDLWFLKGRPQWQQYQQLWGPPETIGTWQAYCQGPLDYPLRHGCVNEIPFYCKKAVSPQVVYGEQGSGPIAEDDDRRRIKLLFRVTFNTNTLSWVLQRGKP